MRLAMKPRFLGNHASQMKSYYGTLSGSHGQTFRIRHEKSRETPPGVDITMTSYPACNKSTFSRKPCIADKKLLLTLSFIIHHKKSPSGEIMMMSYPAGNKILLYRNPCIPDKKLLWNTMRKSWSLFQNPS